jgi:hypothetical protein
MHPDINKAMPIMGVTELRVIAKWVNEKATVRKATTKAADSKRV